VKFRTPLKEECPRLYGAEFFHTHRADLHRILVSLLPSSAATLSSQCISVVQTPDAVVAKFADGTEFEADLIVGADGIQSTVRRSVFGEEAPRFTGNMCWRAVIPFDTPDFNLVSPDSSFWLGPKGQLLAGYPNWHPNVLNLFSKAENIFKWGLFDRDPMQTWSSGRVTLLGDAAHPMLPFLSQGAAMAIEDGYVLGAVLAQDSDPATAFKRYEALRLPRTSHVQLESRKRGETYHISSPLKRIYRDALYRAKQIVNPQTSGIQASWVYSYDAIAEPQKQLT
jgi:salicylate hydroxylase